MSTEHRLQGLRLLVVEDEAMVAMMIEDMLLDLGCEVLGPAGNVDQALEIARREERIAAAVLDINVGGQSIYPVADALRARGVPIVFMSGYGSSEIDVRFAGTPSVQKPFTQPMLEQTLVDAVTSSPR